MDEFNTREFYTRREQQARELAERAHQPEVRSIHLKMASEYAAKALAGSSDRSRLSIAQG